MRHDTQLWAYVGGVFDAAGHIHSQIAEQGNTIVQIVISTPNDELLNKLFDDLDIGTVYIPKSKHRRRGGSYRICIASDIILFCENVIPHVLPKSQALLRLALEHSYRVGRPGQRITPEDRAAREEALLGIWELNGSANRI